MKLCKKCRDHSKGTRLLQISSVGNLAVGEKVVSAFAWILSLVLLLLFSVILALCLQLSVYLPCMDRCQKAAHLPPAKAWDHMNC